MSAYRSAVRSARAALVASHCVVDVAARLASRRPEGLGNGVMIDDDKRP
jgi:hypothetical protein